jgi:hypothetical protein
MVITADGADVPSPFFRKKTKQKENNFFLTVQIIYESFFHRKENNI